MKKSTSPKLSNATMNFVLCPSQKGKFVAKIKSLVTNYFVAKAFLQLIICDEKISLLKHILCDERCWLVDMFFAMKGYILWFIVKNNFGDEIGFVAKYSFGDENSFVAKYSFGYEIIFIAKYSFGGKNYNFGDENYSAFCDENFWLRDIVLVTNSLHRNIHFLRWIFVVAKNVLN